jgi:hypothetical protein
VRPQLGNALFGRARDDALDHPPLEQQVDDQQRSSRRHSGGRIRCAMAAPVCLAQALIGAVRRRLATDRAEPGTAGIG